jgi:hypothetical protein
MAVRLLCLLVLAACSGKRSRVSDAGPPPPPVADAAVTTAPVPLEDRTKDATAVLLRWNQPDAAELLHKTAHERFRKAVTLDELRIFHDDFSARVGVFMAVKSADGVRHTNRDQQDEIVIRGVATFERGDAPYQLVLADEGDAPSMVLFRLELPAALRQPADHDLARRLAVEFRDAVLAVDLARIDAASLPRIRGQLSPDDATRLKGVIAALGGGRKVSSTRDESCGDAMHCLTYRVTGAAGAATLTVTLSAPLGRWRVVDWKFEPDEEMPEP